MRVATKLMLLIAVICVAGVAKAQDLVNVTLTMPQFNQLYVAELDFQNVQSTGVIFTITLQPTPAVTSPIDVRLQISVDATLSGQSPMDIATATTAPITLNPGQPKTITNVDLSGTNPTIPLESWNFNESNFNVIRGIALATSKAPAGVYSVTVNCILPSNPPVTRTEQIVVTNPSRVDLIFPMNQGTVTTTWPRFQWSASTDSVKLLVYEQLPGQQTAQDVVSGSTAYLDQWVTGSSFQYPTSGPGVRQLQDGKTYYWYLELPVGATLGQSLHSDIWSFTVATTDTTSATSKDFNDEATRALVNLLTGTQYQNLLEQISHLNGNATYDGKVIGSDSLITILENMDKSKISSVTIY